MAHTFVKDVMRANPVEMDASVPIRDAASKMISEGIGSIIVTKGGLPAGILTGRDFVTLASEGRELYGPISGIMSFPLVTIGPDDTVWDAAQLMKERGIHKTPVRDGGRIVGILTATDLVGICSLGSDSEMRRICDQIMARMQPE